MKFLITGGVGFIGTNAAAHFAREKQNSITVVDNFSRRKVDANAEYLRKNFSNIKIRKTDIRNTDHYLSDLINADVILHLAGQTAVTTSIADPASDFQHNLLAGFELLECIRNNNPKAVFIYASTNKVYGNLEQFPTGINPALPRYEIPDLPNGVDESIPLHCVSPYGCSKGAMDMYTLDYARIYGLNAVVFRQSCIYGPFQMGVEDQGWVSYFGRQCLLSQPVTIYGNGHQVRDLLHVRDLISAYEAAIARIETAQGMPINIGGGKDNALSLLEVLEILRKKTGKPISLRYSESRPGDQKVFVSSNERAKQLLDWEPKIPFEKGVTEMLDWQKTYFLK